MSQNVVKTRRTPELEAIRAILAVRWGRPVGQREGVDAALLIAYSQLRSGFDPPDDLEALTYRKTGRPPKETP